MEMRNSVGLWERRSGQSKQKLGQALVLSKGEWVNPLTLPDTLGKIQIGNPCRFGTKKDRIYGRELSIGMCQDEENNSQIKIVLIKSFRKRLREVTAEESPRVKRNFHVKSGVEKAWKMFSGMFCPWFLRAGSHGVRHPRQGVESPFKLRECSGFGMERCPR